MYRRHPRSPPFPYTALFHSPASRTSRGMPFDSLARPLVLPSRADPRMEKFIIEGGTPLSGTVAPAGNKNAALPALARSEEHTSELQSRQYLVCRLLLEKNKN